MADDAFALSPITARPTMPTDADYDAICEAFMETTRGRWFLAEYAKRNRNTDTRTVLDAVARLEELIAKDRAPQPENPTEPASTQAESAQRIGELETKIESIADELAGIAALVNASAAPAPTGTNAAAQACDIVRHAGQMVQGVAWTLRESGADGRICTLLDQQAKSIAQAAADIAASLVAQDTPAGTALDAIAARLGALLGTLRARAEDVIELDDMPVTMPHAPPAGAASDRPQPSAPVMVAGHVSDFEFIDRTEEQTAAPVLQLDTDLIDITADAFSVNAGAAHDAPREASAAGAAEAALKAVHDAGAPTPARPDETATLEMAPPPEAAPLKLGDVLTGEGLVRQPKLPPSDPFAQFARMSRAERIAFFS